ncbi:MAG: MFS transporter [Polyangia bacterium]
MEPTQPSKRKLPSVVLWLGMVSLLTDIGTEAVYPLLPLFLADVLHAPRLFIGTVEGMAEATASLLKFFSGRVTDRMDRRKPLTVFGYGLSSLVRPLVGFAVLPWHVLATRVADRVGKGLRSSPRDALLADAAPADMRGRAYGFHQAMDNAGAVIGPLVATGLLAAGVALRNVFLLSAVPGALAMGALVFGVREERVTHEAKARALVPLSAETKTALGRYLGAIAIFGLGNSSDAFLLLRATQCGVATRWIPLIWMAHNATKAALSTWGGSLSDRVDRRHVLIGGWAIYALVYLGFGYATSAWQMWALFVVYGAYYALTEGTAKALVADLAPPAARGRVFGWYNATVGIVALPASLMFGALTDRYGAHVPFIVAASLALVAAGWLMLVRLPRPGDENP